MQAIPPFVVEYFLLGKTQPETLDRLAQDGGIVTDVWLSFAAQPWQPQRVLLAPQKGITETELGSDLHRCLIAYRSGHRQAGLKKDPSVSPIEQYVAVTLYLDELLRLVLPLTSWWHQMNIALLRQSDAKLAQQFEERLISILGRTTPARLGTGTDEPAWKEKLRAQRVMDAGPVAALVGLFIVARDEPGVVDEVASLDPRRPRDAMAFEGWVLRNSLRIAQAARAELCRDLESALLAMDPAERVSNGTFVAPSPGPAPRIHRLFLDRKAALAIASGTRTIKADAANRLFDISCRNLTWAVIDSGIASKHAAFARHPDSEMPSGNGAASPSSRVRRTYDFTRIQRIKSFDLTVDAPGTDGRKAKITALADELDSAFSRTPSVVYRATAEANLTLIAQQLDQRINPDWSLIEPLIRVSDDDTENVVADHGTHVAGIIAADWRADSAGQTEKVMQGVCPDIQLFDIRVVNDVDLKATESALLAAMDFIRYLNDREVTKRPLICGVNISLSIPHDVRNYGCGATPVCVAADRLANSGVVVVAAAGNRGWNEQELGFGTFVMCSITDPGNAHEVITVGATHRDQPHTYGVSFFSSRGPTGDGRVKPDLLAPGEKILGPLPGDIDGRKNGTSMAAPFVSGAAALLMARYPELIGRSSEVKRLLCESATDLGRERYFQGHGLVDVLRALQSV